MCSDSKSPLNNSLPVWIEIVTIKKCEFCNGYLHVPFLLSFVMEQMTLLFVLVQKWTKLYKIVQMDSFKFVV